MAEKEDKIKKESPFRQNNALIVNKEPTRKEIERTTAIFEAWVVNAEKDPKVYVLLLHKKGKDWWELPGGEISGTSRTENALKAETLRELEEEAAIDILTTEGMTSLNKDPSVYVKSTGNRITDGEKNITSYPFVAREHYTELPRVNLELNPDIPERSEEDKYLWLDVTDLYSLATYRKVFHQNIDVLNEAWNNQSPLSVFVSNENEKVAKLTPFTNQEKKTTIALNTSRVTISNLIKYVAYTINDLQPPEGINRPDY